MDNQCLSRHEHEALVLAIGALRWLRSSLPASSSVAQAFDQVAEVWEDCRGEGALQLARPPEDQGRRPVRRRLAH